MGRTHLTPLFAVALVLAALTSVQAKTPSRAEPKRMIQQRILGYWAIEPSAMLAAMKRKARKENNGAKIDEAAQKNMAKIVDRLANRLVLEFKSDGSAISHQPEKAAKATYRILNASPTSGEFTIEVEPEDEDEEAGPASGEIQGDQLTLIVEEEEKELHFMRLTNEQAKKRLAKWAE